MHNNNKLSLSARSLDPQHKIINDKIHKLPSPWDGELNNDMFVDIPYMDFLSCT